MGYTYLISFQAAMYHPCLRIIEIKANQYLSSEIEFSFAYWTSVTLKINSGCIIPRTFEQN